MKLFILALLSSAGVALTEDILDILRSKRRKTILKKILKVLGG